MAKRRVLRVGVGARARDAFPSREPLFFLPTADISSSLLPHVLSSCPSTSTSQATRLGYSPTAKEIIRRPASLLKVLREMIPLLMVLATRAPTRTAPANSQIAAASKALRSVREREETLVAKELATSCAVSGLGVSWVQTRRADATHVGADSPCVQTGEEERKDEKKVELSPHLEVESVCGVLSEDGVQGVLPPASFLYLTLVLHCRSSQSVWTSNLRGAHVLNLACNVHTNPI